MEKRRETDGRSRGREAPTELRKRALAQVRAAESPEIVAAAPGIHRTTTYEWLSLYRHEGASAPDANTRGGRRRKLEGKAMRWTSRTVATKNPRQFQFPVAPWTCEMIGELIWRRLAIRRSRSAVGRLFDQLGLRARRPLRRAYQQNPEEVERWQRHIYRKIQAEARACRAEIYFGGEAGVRSADHSGTTWAPRGRTPIVSSTGARFGFNLMSAISARRRLRFMIVARKVGAATFITFLKRLLHGTTQPVPLLVDGHPSHRAKAITAFIESPDGKLRLFFLPPCSPELNPDEMVWSSLKSETLGRRAHHDKAGLKRAALSHLRFLQKPPPKCALSLKHHTLPMLRPRSMPLLFCIV